MFGRQTHGIFSWAEAEWPFGQRAGLTTQRSVDWHHAPLCAEAGAAAESDEESIEAERGGSTEEQAPASCPQACEAKNQAQTSRSDPRV